MASPSLPNCSDWGICWIGGWDTHGREIWGEWSSPLSSPPPRRSADLRESLSRPLLNQTGTGSLEGVFFFPLVMKERTPVVGCSSSVGLPRRENSHLQKLLTRAELFRCWRSNLCLLPDSEFSMYRAPAFWPLPRVGAANEIQRCWFYPLFRNQESWKFYIKDTF